MSPSLKSTRANLFVKTILKIALNSMVGLGRLELPTSRLSGVRSNHLSYKPKSLKRRYVDGTEIPEQAPRRTRSLFFFERR